ncbi:TetR family transcriptional regulator [Burkholderia lata]|uniref:TetR/AcrR family transcriptional regulator n=1 Tax=Burkholderia lata (strain ATCC 17760 / DSM 23089 / LMG 22485 / NCIMB 9086 / R18194 / 383) TaxID=482957 RepID=UPI0014541F0A|nr:helix-turn-helix domain-containing protein [Burkholderia lata]VWD15554.1 TetR family transcriptional regulator [Burkholderia lata]
MTNPAGSGRPREFELEDAARDAMEVFWDHGYEGASLPDLIAGTGLSRGSLYKAFGDKKALLLAALDLYMADGLKATADILSQPGTVKEAIRDSLLRHARLSVGKAGRRGCFAIAMTTELAARDADVAKRTGRMFRRLQQLYAGALVRG